MSCRCVNGYILVGRDYFRSLNDAKGRSHNRNGSKAGRVAYQHRNQANQRLIYCKYIGVWDLSFSRQGVAGVEAVMVIAPMSFSPPWCVLNTDPLGREANITKEMGHGD